MFDHCLYFNTAALARRLEKEWAVAFKPFNLAPPQAFMLRAVLAAPGALQSELAATLAISRPTATRALDGLEAKKMVARRSTRQDGRHMAVHPTAAAIAMGADLDAASAEVTQRLKKVLGAREFDSMVEEIKGTRSALK